MKKILMTISAFIMSLLIGFSVTAATLPVQNGTQTADMSIDNGLKILGLNPGDFIYKKTINVTDTNTDFAQYFSENAQAENIDNPDYYTPIEVLGITESYENIDEGWIDSYIYIYTPYKINALGKTYDAFTFNLFDQLAIMFMVNENKMNIAENQEGWWLGIQGHVGGGLDADIYNYQGINRHYVHSSEESTVSEGVLRLLFRVYKKADLEVKRKYYVETIPYRFWDDVTQKYWSASCTPSIYSYFSAVDEEGNVDSGTDMDGFTDSDIFQVKRKSVICVEAYCYIDNWKALWIDKSNVYILLRNKATGEYIDNCQAMQIIYKLKGDKNYRDAKKDNIGATNFYSIQNVYSKQGQFGDMTKTSEKNFVDNVMPYIEGGYNFSELPQYKWSWNYKITECKVVYIWTEVEAGTIVQGSTYANGLHTEYDDNGNCLGVFDKDGNEVEGINYTSSGVLLNENGTVRLPEGSTDVVVDNDESILEMIVNAIVSFVEEVFATDNIAFKLVGIIIISIPVILILTILLRFLRTLFGKKE